MGVVLHHPGIGAVIETTDIGGDGGEAQAHLHEQNGWVRVPDDVLDEVRNERGGISHEAFLANVQTHLAPDVDEATDTPEPASEPAPRKARRTTKKGNT